MALESCCRKQGSEVVDCPKISSSGEEKRKKTVLFVPLDCVGHVNSLISIADSLKNLGHRTVFLFLDPMDGGLKKRGHEVYDCSQEGLVESETTEENELKWDKIVAEMGKLWRSSLMDNFEQTTRVGLGSMMKDIMAKDDIIGSKLDLIKPDFIVIDHYFIQPALIKYGKPWARVFSATPLSLHPEEHNLPPSTTGFPSRWLEDEQKKDYYLEFRERMNEIKKEVYDEWSEYLVKEHSLPPTPTNPISGIPLSPYLNVYMYPYELDYNEFGILEAWHRCDSILRINSRFPERDEDNETESALPKFEIPELLRDKPGKLIFLSMGSLASADVELMKRLVAILAKSPNRFIVSRGLNWQKYELAPNMWGEKFVDQLAILPAIDLIITHGGNNTITECFYFGVPGFVVCPVFADQADNAQRIEEVNLGRRVDPFKCEEEELLDAIEQVLADPEIKPRMEAIKERMQRPENKFKAIKLFRDFVEGSDCCDSDS